MQRHDDLRLILGMTSGKELSVDHVMLFPEPDVLQLISLKVKAQEQLGSLAAGLGLWAAGSWTMGGASVLDIVETAVSNSKTKKGMALLNKAAMQYDWVKSKGEFLPVYEIEGVESPNPCDWRAMHEAESRINFNEMASGEKALLMQKYGLSRRQIRKGAAAVTGMTGYIHDGDDFIAVLAGAHGLCIRWSCVAHFELA